ncbi:DUF4352 domain-containing protein [Streptomyces sp. NP160]|uniref:DUF4352 domain-containing protein n=1 Tax=Streptomyces sp. NP160 TaxID=2586637 RepID=UPI00111BA5A9|nr:DUF4352 domain-containing protein [Streptomyces sp. NP160]TNM61052.1 DUF4352 domain-containing protein [Streptomyces sp. NP160]
MGTSEHRSATTARLRGLTVVSALGAVLLLGGCTGGGGEEPSPTSPASSDASTPGTSSTAPSPRPSSTSESPSYSGPPPATAPVVGATTLPAVEVGSAADFGDGLRVTVTGVRAAQLESGGPGDASGAGVAVAVEVENGSEQPVDLSGLTVTAAYGDDLAASSTTGAPADLPTGVLAPGASGEGVWAFAVPEADRGSLVLTITSNSSSAAVVVRS